MSIFKFLNNPDDDDLIKNLNSFNTNNGLESIKTNKSFREISNEIALTTPFGRQSAFYKPEYVEDNIDFQKLVDFISNKKDALFDWKNFIGYTTKTVTSYVSFGQEAKFDRMRGIPTRYTTLETIETENPLKLNEFSGERILNLKAKLNKEIAVVNINKDNDKDITNGLEFEFDYKRRKVDYKLHYYYIDKKRVYEKDNKGEIAFTISSSNFEDFEAFIKQSKLLISDSSNFKKQIKDAFVTAIKALNDLPKKIKNEDEKEKYNSKKFLSLDWLYSKIPHFVALDLDFDQALLHVFQLDEWDRSIAIGRDTTQSITTLLSRLNPNKVYDYFYENPQTLIKLIIEFDEEAYAELFFQYLTVIALSKQGIDKLENARVFSINERAHIETNILYGDDEGKVELTNEFDLSGLVPTLNGIDIASYFTKDVEINNPKNASNQFHPLELIYIQQYDPILSEAIKVPTVAIYAKYLGDKGEWADVLTATFAVIDLVSIVLSGGALSAGVRGIRAAFAIIDITISTINLVTLSPAIKKELSKTEAGKWFVAHWPLISFCVSGGMISVYLAKGILKYGNTVKGQLKNKPNLSKNIDELIEESGKVVKQFKKVSDSIIRKELGEEFIDALKAMGIKEKRIISYFTDYHNANGFRFLNEIEDLLIKYPNLSKTEAITLWGYTTNLFYFQLNSWLRLGKNALKTKQISVILTGVINKIPKYNGLAYRAIGLEGEALVKFLNEHKAGKIVSYKEFVSCGSNKKAAFFDKDGKNVFIKFSNVKNAPIISDFADGIKFRGYNREELLLFQNRKFEIISYDKISRGHLIEMKQIN